MLDDNSKPRIKIRHKRISDARDDYAWQTDPELARLDATDPLTMTYQQFLSEFTFDLCYPSSNRHEFGVETTEGLHIGNCVYYNVNQAESKTEMGIMIGNREYWNKGYGTETVNALVDYVFNHTNLERVYLTTLDWNLRAQKCFKKCGFQECGELVRDEHIFILMAISRPEWQKKMRPTKVESDPIQSPK
jgi:RimJ/RimL family protein N-acetyltransferase